LDLTTTRSFVLIIAVCFVGWPSLLSACSFCPTKFGCPACETLTPTLTKSIEHAKVAVLAKLVKAPDFASAESLGDLPRARFKIDRFIKGKSFVSADETSVTIAYDGKAVVGDEFLLLGDHYLLQGSNDPYLAWRYPVKLDKANKKYLFDLLALPPNRPQRLEFFLDHREEKNQVVSFDVENELGSASYEQLKTLKSRLNRDQLLAWSNLPDLSVERRQLYWTLLGICGDTTDIAYFEKILTAQQSDPNLALSAAITSYLALTGVEGVNVVEALFFEKANVEPYRTYAAIQALRVHSRSLL
jgi:hypothetical protein